MKPGLLSKFGAAFGAFKAGAAVAKSAFYQAFATGRDITGGDWTQGKLVKPYEQSAWINRAIQLKVDEIARVPLKFYDGQVEYTDPDFLSWWANPFLGAAGQAINLHSARKQLASWPDLGGEFFILLGDDWLNPFAARTWRGLSKPVIARPDRMRHVVQGGKLIGWEFTDAASHRFVLLPEQVIHSPLWNPYDDFRGLATVKVVMNAAEADYLAGLYIRNLMRNNGDQGVYVIAKSGTVNDEQREQIIASLREKRMRSLRGDFSAAFLTGDITVEDPKAQAPGAELNAGRVLSHHEIFLGLGLPPSMADVKASYSIGADSDRFTLITGTCMPLSSGVDAALSLIASIQQGRSRAVNGQWVSTGVPFTAESDWDDHPVVQNVRRERVDTAIKLWETGMPMAFANDYLDLGMKPFPGWKTGYLPFSVSAVQADDATTTTPAAPAADDDIDDVPEFDETLGDDSLKHLRLLILARQRQAAAKALPAPAIEEEFKIFACTCHGAPISTRARDPKRIARWKDHMGKRRKTLKEYEGRITRLLWNARVETLKKISLHAASIDAAAEKSVTRAAAADITFDKQGFAEKFFAEMRKQAVPALDDAGKTLFQELGRDDAFKYPDPLAKAYIAARQNKLADVPEEIFSKIKQTLQDGLDKGDTASDLAGRVKDAFKGISDGRARTIASTETGAAYGSGRAEAMKQAGVEWKEWLTSGNANVRPAHEEAEGQRVAADEAFIVDGEELMFPGDEAGSAGNVINCHCVSIAVADGPEDEK